MACKQRTPRARAHSQIFINKAIVERDQLPNVYTQTRAPGVKEAKNRIRPRAKTYTDNAGLSSRSQSVINYGL